jgi:formylglycine-generating enzyme required for sulfatase activity
MTRLLHLTLFTTAMGFGTVNFIGCDSDKKSAKGDKDSDDDDEYRSSKKKVHKPEAGDIQEVTINDTSFTMSYAPAGSFDMGPLGDDKNDQSGDIQHTVILTQSFHISTTEVTQALYTAVTGEHPWRDKPRGISASAGECFHFSETAKTDDNYPAYCVNWHDAAKFCNALSEIEGLDTAYSFVGATVSRDKGASGYRLPTEAEWEYVANANGTYTYSGSNDIEAVGWYIGNSEGQLHPVGTKAANAWGIYDMSGNLQEWIGDWDGNYSTGNITDPSGPPTGRERIIRGGSFKMSAEDSQVTRRARVSPGFANDLQGFRIVRPEQPTD